MPRTAHHPPAADLFGLGDHADLIRETACLEERGMRKADVSTYSGFGQMRDIAITTRESSGDG